jgi:hypothetical protein
VQRIRNRSFTAATGVALILGGALGYSSPATAQPTTPGMDPGFFPATGYRIGSPALLNYFQHRGAVRTFGYPVSNEFPLLGRRVQIFQRQMLEIAPDGSVTASNILDPDVLPISRIDGLSLPPADPDVLWAAPSPADPEYATQVLAFINVFVPDEWNALPVNFQSTFLNTVGCADAFGTDPCDQSLLPSSTSVFNAGSCITRGRAARRRGCSSAIGSSESSSASIYRLMWAPRFARLASLRNTLRRVRWLSTGRTRCRIRRWPKRSRPTPCPRPRRWTSR